MTIQLLCAIGKFQPENNLSPRTFRKPFCMLNRFPCSDRRMNIPSTLFVPLKFIYCANVVYNHISTSHSRPAPFSRCSIPHWILRILLLSFHPRDSIFTARTLKPFCGPVRITSPSVCFCERVTKDTTKEQSNQSLEPIRFAHGSPPRYLLNIFMPRHLLQVTLSFFE